MHATFRFFLLIAALCLPAAVFSACSRPTAETPYEAQLAARPDPETASSMEDSIIFEEPDSPSHNVLQELLGRPDTAAAEDINDQDIPRVALIIDDMGYHQELGEKLIELNLNLTFSFLPNAPHTRELVESAHARERDILVHLPMEPKGQQWDPGPDALMIEESSARIQEKTSTLIGLVPHAIGVNNHMGSLFTEQPAPMRDVLTVIDRHGLFFVDSFTTAQSVGFSEARAMHIPTARRHVFLDNIHRSDTICDQLEQLSQIALSKGSAIGIGHPNTATLKALDQCAPSILTSVQLVGVHELVH